MQNISQVIRDIFQLGENSALVFDDLAFRVFNFQYKNNPVYKEYCNLLDKSPAHISHIEEIPFLPISFFKTHKITTGQKEEIVFTSSGTRKEPISRHYVHSIKIYQKSFLKAFELFYGNHTDYCILALLPGYLEREGSSLIYMANELIHKSKYKQSDFFLYDFEPLHQVLKQNESKGIKTLLIGVSFALLDFANAFPMSLNHTLVMETGGMKGRRKELTRKELHRILKMQLGVKHIHSEYGMTELLSQAYATKEGKYHCPPWMRILIRQANDPFSYEKTGKTGGINVIDLANIYSCSFIETMDLGRHNTDNAFEVLGRFDNSDVRGCNLMVE